MKACIGTASLTLPERPIGAASPWSPLRDTSIRQPAGRRGCAHPMASARRCPRPDARRRRRIHRRAPPETRPWRCSPPTHADQAKINRVALMADMAARRSSLAHLSDGDTVFRPPTARWHGRTSLESACSRGGAVGGDLAAASRPRAAAALGPGTSAPCRRASVELHSRAPPSTRRRRWLGSGPPYAAPAALLRAGQPRPVIFASSWRPIVPEKKTSRLGRATATAQRVVYAARPLSPRFDFTVAPRMWRLAGARFYLRRLPRIPLGPAVRGLATALGRSVRCRVAGSLAGATLIWFITARRGCPVSLIVGGVMRIYFTPAGCSHRVGEHPAAGVMLSGFAIALPVALGAAAAQRAAVPRPPLFGDSSISGRPGSADWLCCAPAFIHLAGLIQRPTRCQPRCRTGVASNAAPCGFACGPVLFGMRRVAIPVSSPRCATDGADHAAAGLVGRWRRAGPTGFVRGRHPVHAVDLGVRRTVQAFSIRSVGPSELRMHGGRRGGVAAASPVDSCCSGAQAIASSTRCCSSRCLFRCSRSL